MIRRFVTASGLGAALRASCWLLLAATLTACKWSGSDDASPPSGLSYTTPRVFQVGTAIPPLRPTVTGTVTSYSVAPSLPAGLALDSGSGEISGTPSAVAAASDYVVTASNRAGSTTAVLSITVNPAPPSGLAYPGPQTYSAGVAIAPLSPGVTGVVSSYAVSPALPQGLVLDPVTGVISGRPLAGAAQANYTVTAANVSGSTSFALSITVIVDSASAVIGAAGGTLTGPDGVQIVVPAGALQQSATLRIARSALGAPGAFPPDLTQVGAVYEFTPHDVIFDLPVTLRIPVAAGTTAAEAFTARVGEDWELAGSRLVNGYAEWQRNSLSWGFVGLACSPTAGDPYACVWPSGNAVASAVPVTALTRIGSSSPNGNAGAWRVDQPGVVSLTMTYTAAPDCTVNGQPSSGQVRLVSIDLGAPVGSTGRVTTLFDAAVGLTSTTVAIPAGSFNAGGGTALRGRGTTTVDVSAHLGNTTNVFVFSFTCSRPGRAPMGGSDLITIRGPMPVPAATFTIGGAVTGLAASGLVLRLNGADDLAVTTNGAFTFSQRLTAGANYNVTVATQPAGQQCAVQNGSGAAVGNVSNVSVSCSMVVTTVTIGGAVSGLTGSGLVLRNNGGDPLPISSNGGFAFATPINAGGAFNVTIATQPGGQTCTVQNGTGTATGNITSVAVTCVADATQAINDTGVTASQCYQSASDALVSCLSAPALALSDSQDGMRGRDSSVATNGAADGALGFSFTKISASGVALDAGATAWSCVRDNVSGLMWEVKTNDGGLRDWARRYSNWDSTTQIQDGGAPVTQAVIDAPTNSIGFVNAVNAAGLCGFSDWRRPTSEELASLVNYGVSGTAAAIDPAWFPNTRTTPGQARYFTSSPIGDYSLGVLFDQGFSGAVASSGRANWYLRLVRDVN